MEENEQLGRHLVASEDIKPDLILFKDKPLILSYKLDTLEYTMNKICLGCYKEIPPSFSAAVRKKKGKRAKKDHYYSKKNQDDEEDRKAQMKPTSAVASLLQKVVAVDKERKKKEEQKQQQEQTALSGEPGNVGKKSSLASTAASLQSRNNEKDHHNDHGQRENDDDDGGGDGAAADDQHYQQKEQDDNNNNDDDDGHGGGVGVDDDNDEISSSSSVEEEESDDDGDSDNSLDDDDEVESEGDVEEVEQRKVCLSCHLPICSQLCSTQYFHKNFECKLVREAYSHQHQQRVQQQQQKLQNVAGNTGAAAAQKKNLSEKELSSSSSVKTGGEQREKQSSNQESVSLGTTCKNKGNSCSSTTTTTTTIATFPSRNMITSMKNGIRENILRNLLYLRCILLKHVNEGHWNQLISLQSNEETRKGDVASLEKSTRVFATMKKIMTEINHPTLTSRQLVYKPDIHKLVGIIDINALHLNVSQNVEVTGIYPTFSLMEHSCIPSVKFYLVPCGTCSASINAASTASSNSSFTTSPSTAATAAGENYHHKKASTFFELYCRSAIKLKSGDHLSVSYSNAMWNTEKRREFLKKERHFLNECECTRCKDPSELGTHFSSILCPLPDCRGICAPVIPQQSVATTMAATPVTATTGGGGRTGSSNEMQWKCTSSKCSKTIANWQLKILDGKLCEMVARTTPTAEGYKEILSKMEELVHPDYYLCCIVRHSLIQMVGHDKDSVSNKALIEDKIAICNSLIGVIKKLDPGLANLNIYASIVFYEMQNAVLALAGAEVDDDFHILRRNPETVNLAKVYLQKCIDCFKYEFLETPENKLKILAMKKMEYLNTVMNKR